MAKKDEKLTLEETMTAPVKKTEVNFGDVPEKGKEIDVSTTRRQWIAEAAYHRACARGFEPGYEESDWLEAEQEYEKTHSAMKED